MFRNIFSNWALVGVQFLVLAIATPAQVHALGESVASLWLSVNALTSILGLLLLGVPMASVRFIAVHVERKEIAEANRVIATCLGICLVLGGVALVAGGGLWFFFEKVEMSQPKWQSLGPSVMRDARVAYWLSVLQIALGFAMNLPFGVLDAQLDFLARNGVKMGGLVLRVLVVVLVLVRIPSLVVVALSQLGVTALEFALAMLLIRRRSPGIRFGLGGFDRQRIREIVGFSLFAMLVTMGSQLAFQSDQLVISAAKSTSADDGVFFDVGNKPFPVLLQLILGIGMVMMPTATRLQAKGDFAELRADFLKWSKVAYSLVLLVGVYLLVLAPEFDAMWMGPSYAMSSGRITRVLMLSFLFFLPVRGVASPMLMGLGKPKAPAFAFVAMGVVNLLISVALVKPLGIYGVAVGTAIPGVLFAVVVAVLACREVGIRAGEYFGYVMLRPSLGVLPPLFLLYFIKRGLHVFNIFATRAVELPRLVFSGVAMVSLFAVVWILYVYRKDPYFDLPARFDRFVPGPWRGTIAGRAVVSFSGLAVILGSGILAIALRDAEPIVGLLLSVAAAMAGLLLILVEMLARGIIRRRGGYYRYQPHRCELHEYAPGQMPGFPLISRFEINAAGERGDPPPLPGEPCYRALVVGGSAAECSYLDQDATWPAVVQRILAEPAHLAVLGSPPRVHVGNVARSIVPVEGLTLMLRRILPRYPKLDAMLIMVGGADVVSWVERGASPTVAVGEFPPDRLFEHHPEIEWGWRPRQTALWRMLAQLRRRYRRPYVRSPGCTTWLPRVRRMRAESTERVDATPDPSPMLDHFAKSLRVLLETARAHAHRVILVRQPWFGPDPTPEEEAMFWNYGFGRPYKEKVTRYLTPRAVDALMRAMDARAAEVASSMGVEQIDVSSRIEHSARTFYDELHFTPAGAEQVGEVVAAAMLGLEVGRAAKGATESDEEEEETSAVA
jgi:O-antigen/teichoic acid export membrane protein